MKKGVIIAGLIALCVAFLFPPFHEVRVSFNSGIAVAEENKGFHFIFNPPQPHPGVGYIIRISWDRLGLICAGIIGLTTVFAILANAPTVRTTALSTVDSSHIRSKHAVLSEPSAALGRAWFAALSVGTVVIQVAASSTGAPDETVFVSALLCVLLAALRLRSIGYPAIWAPSIFIPIANIVMGYRLFAFPPNFAQTKQADTAMRAIGWVYAVFLIILLAAILIPLFHAF